MRKVYIIGTTAAISAFIICAAIQAAFNSLLWTLMFGIIAIAAAVAVLIYQWNYNELRNRLDELSRSAAALYPIAKESEVEVAGLRIAHDELASKLPAIEPSEGRRALRVEHSELVAQYRQLIPQLATAERKCAEAVLAYNLVAEQFNVIMADSTFRWLDEGNTRMAKRAIIATPAFVEAEKVRFPPSPASAALGR